MDIVGTMPVLAELFEAPSTYPFPVTAVGTLVFRTDADLNFLSSRLLG